MLLVCRSIKQFSPVAGRMQQQITNRARAFAPAPAALRSRRGLHVTASSASVSRCASQLRTVQLQTTRGLALIRGLCHRAVTCKAWTGRTALTPGTVVNLQAIQQVVADNKVVVYSATYCPYCSQVRHHMLVTAVSTSNGCCSPCQGHVSTH